MRAFAPWPVAQTAPPGAHAASSGRHLKLTVVRRIRAGHQLSEPTEQAPASLCITLPCRQRAPVRAAIPWQGVVEVRASLHRSLLPKPQCFGYGHGRLSVSPLHPRFQPPGLKASLDARARRFRCFHVKINDYRLLPASNHDRLANLVWTSVDLLMRHVWRHINKISSPGFFAQFQMIAPSHSHPALHHV